MSSRLLLITTVLALAGCVAAPTDPTEKSAAILGGEADTPDQDKAVVTISSLVDDGTGDKYANCSGVLISPLLVLSAAHCFDPQIAGPLKVINVFFGADSKDKSQTAGVAPWRVGVSFTLDPLFTERLADHDLAILVLNTPFTTATPLPILRTPPTVNSAMRLVGYGLTEAQDPNSWGARYQTSVTISGVDATSLWSDDGVHSGCEGDSGGAGIVNLDGADVLAGVISGSLGNANCASGSKLSRVDQSLDFIDAQLAAHDPDVVAIDMGAPPDFGEALVPPPSTHHASGCTTVGGTADLASLFLLMVALYVARRRLAA